MIGGGGLFFVLLLFVAVVVFTKKSFRYPCMIAIPTGDHAEEVIFVADKFKIRKRKSHTEIWFEKHRGKCYPPPYNFWTRFWKKKTALPNDEEDFVKLKDADLRKHLLRGAMFYKVSEMEYKPMTVTREGNFKVLDYDSTELIIDDIEREHEVTSSFKDKLLGVGLWLGSIIIIGLIAIAIIVLTFNYAGDQSQAIIDAARAAAVAGAEVGG